MGDAADADEPADEEVDCEVEAEILNEPVVDGDVVVSLAQSVEDVVNEHVLSEGHCVQGIRAQTPIDVRISRGSTAASTSEMLLLELQGMPSGCRKLISQPFDEHETLTVKVDPLPAGS